jgi:hypothetical protein
MTVYTKKNHSDFLKKREIDLVANFDCDKVFGDEFIPHHFIKLHIV